MRDLGLSYDEAAHGLQSAIRFLVTREGIADSGAVESMLKHLRVGVDARAADALGLAELLIKKGVITQDEYVEHMRLALNEELARYEQYVRQKHNLPANTSFR